MLAESAPDGNQGETWILRRPAEAMQCSSIQWESGGGLLLLDLCLGGPEGHSCAQPGSEVLHVFSIESRSALLSVASALCGFTRLWGKGAFS